MESILKNQQVSRKRKSAATGTCGAPKKAASRAATVTLKALACIIAFVLYCIVVEHGLKLEDERMRIEHQRWLEQVQKLEEEHRLQRELENWLEMQQPSR